MRQFTFWLAITALLFVSFGRYAWLLIATMTAIMITYDIVRIGKQLNVRTVRRIGGTVSQVQLAPRSGRTSDTRSR